MSKLLSTLRKMQDTGKWTPYTRFRRFPRQACDEPDLTELDGQTIELVLDEPAPA